MATRRRAKSGPDGERRNRESELLDAAIEVFWNKGYSAATIQDVADRVGVLKGSLYYYIDSKEDLLFRVFDESHRQAQEIADSVVADGGTALHQLHAYFTRYVLWYLQNLERVSLYMNEWRYLTGERLESVLEQRRTYEDLVRGLIERAQEEGAVGSFVNAKYASFFVLGAVNGVPTWYQRQGSDPPERIAAAYGDMIVGMLTAPAPDPALTAVS
jgi:AcrR family transcriptional regulator